MRVATYTRISTDEEHQPFSLEAQAERLKAYIAIQDGWQLVARFTDQMTGSKLERPGLQKALHEAKLGHYDLLLVYRVDRLARSVRGLAQILDELDQSNVVFRSATEPFDTSAAAGRMMVQMLGVFAEFERATLIDRVVAGMERKAARGGWLGGQVPFGYRFNSETGFLEVEEAEARLVPVIFDLYGNQKLGVQSVAKWLNQNGHRTRAGRRWSFLSVLSVLRNEVYRGQILFRGTYHPAPHTAIIDAPLFGSVQKLLEVRGKDHAKRRTNPTDYLLGGLLTCGRCGGKYSGTAAHGRMYRYRYYTCLSRQKYGQAECDSERLPAEQLDELIIEALMEFYGDPARVHQAFQMVIADLESDRPSDRSELAAVRRELDKTEESLERYFHAFEAGTMPENQCGPRIRILSDRLMELKLRHGELSRAVEETAIADVPDEIVTIVHRRIREAVEGGSEQVRKALIQQLVADVRIDSREAIYPTFRLPQVKVRELYGMVGRGGLEPPTSALSARRSAS